MNTYFPGIIKIGNIVKIKDWACDDKNLWRVSDIIGLDYYMYNLMSDYKTIVPRYEKDLE